MQKVEKPLIAAKDLTKIYEKKNKALYNVSFEIYKGECLGLVGESGSGKSTLAKCLLGLEKIDGGVIEFKGLPFLKGTKSRMLSNTVQAVFQNPSASLNPKLKVINSLMEPLDFTKRGNPSFLKDIQGNRASVAERLMEMVHLPSKFLTAYPHELSGGQKQRIAIARAISTGPELIILDEPTASLDVSIQAKILNLLKDLQEQLGLSYLFISHDLASINFISDRMLVMKDGTIVDECRRHTLFSEERHPYTKNLLDIFEA